MPEMHAIIIREKTIIMIKVHVCTTVNVMCRLMGLQHDGMQKSGRGEEDHTIM